MRIIVFFDLPVQTKKNRRDYVRFRKFLTKNGFMMMQESVYCKLALNQTVTTAACEAVRKNKPPEGLVQMLVITEKQFNNMETVCGESTGNICNTDERLIFL